MPLRTQGRAGRVGYRPSPAKTTSAAGGSKTIPLRSRHRPRPPPNRYNPRPPFPHGAPAKPAPVPSAPVPSPSVPVPSVPVPSVPVPSVPVPSVPVPSVPVPSVPSVPVQNIRVTSLVAIATNYVGTPSFLPGCEEDLAKMVPLFQRLYGIPSERTVVLRGAEATKAGILTAMTRAVHALSADEQLLIYYSGHGTQTVDRSGDEVDGLDECLVPHDYATSGFIIDDTLGALWTEAATGSHIAAIFDSCNSATVADLGANSTEPMASVLTMSGCVDNSTAQSIVTPEGWRGALSFYLEQQLQTALGLYMSIDSRVQQLNVIMTREHIAQRIQYQVRGVNTVFPFPTPA